MLRFKRFLATGMQSVVIFLFLQSMLLDDVLGQSPWTPGKNKFYSQFSFVTIPEYSRLFLWEGGEFETSRKAVDNTLQLYGEYGVSQRFSLLVSVPYKILKSGDLNPDYQGDPEGIPEGASINAFGNINLGVKYNILQKKWVMGVQLNVELPANVGDAETTGLYPGYDAFAVAPLVSVGRGWSQFYFYGFASTLFRSNEFDDKFDLGIEGGWKPARPLWIITYFQWVKSFNNGTKTPWPAARQFGLYSPLQEYTAYGLKLIYEIGLSESYNLGFIAHGAGSFSGNFVAKSPLLSLGVFLKKI